MALTAPARLSHARFVTSQSGFSPFSKKLNHIASVADDGFGRTLMYSAGLTRQIAEQTGDTSTAEKASSVEKAALTFRMVIGSIRGFYNLFKLFTGQIFYEHGFRKVTHFKAPSEAEKNNLEYVNWREDPNIEDLWHNESAGFSAKNNGPITIDNKRFWAQDPETGDWVNAVTRERSVDGKYIDDEAGDYVKRDWMNVAMDLLVLAARFITPVRYGHALGLYDLGKHANTLKAVSIGLWTTILTLSVFQSIRDLINETELTNLPKMTWESIQGGLDLLALPFDFGLADAHIGLAIAGSIINFTAGISTLLKEGAYYNAP